MPYPVSRIERCPDVSESQLTDAVNEESMPGMPVVTRHRVELPLTTLSYAECGSGEPLIMVPATISQIDDWLPFIHFMGQRYHAHFFELPGHGGSTPFAEPFSSDLVAQMVEQFADEQGFERFVLMGFSFGAVLTLKTLQHLGDRVSKVILLAPYVSKHGLQHNFVKLNAVRAATATAKRRLGRAGWLKMIRDPRAVDFFVWFMTTVGKFETTADLRGRLLDFEDASFDTLRNQVAEILTTVEEDLAGPFTQPCFFGMSVNDPLLDFETSLRFVQSEFTDPVVVRWDFPFHAPPERFTFERLNRDYIELLDSFGD